MAYFNRTYQIKDGERIEGSWRHIFIRNGDTYFLTDLKVYADGTIDCWGLLDFATFRQKVASGWVATTFPQDAVASAHHLARWRFDKPRSSITPQELIAEVTDEIERLAGRLTTEERCLAALDRYVDNPSAEHLMALREAYLAVPEHLRLYLLGDQDAKDGPLRTLLTPVGQALLMENTGVRDRLIQQSDHDHAWDYFHRRRDEQRQTRAVPPPWEDDAVTSASSIVRFDTADGGHPYLSNDYPAPITLDGDTFPTVEHAYWALATTDPDSRHRVVHAATTREARTIGQGAPLRPDWNVVRLAIMTRLVREKFHQHPDLAAKLLATGDGRLINGVDFSRYWGDYRQGRNWLGRILEIVRAELQVNARL